MHTKKQKILIIAIWIFILLIGIGIGFRLGKIKYSKNGNSGEVKKQIEQKESFVGEYKVARVIDGDTIEIEGGERVRYIGIDAPETVDPEKPVECFGREATDGNKKLVEGKMVRLEKDATDRDKYNRLLRYAYVGDTFVNLELVKLGFATAAAYPPDTKYQKEFSSAEQEAKKSKSGLWTACQGN